jgi:CO/xanthine dehydrogenase FAD-binding subunit
MLLPKFEFHRPSSLDETCQMLSELGGQAKLLAGGTDLLVAMKKKLVKPQYVVALDHVDELNRVTDGKTVIRIGARATAAGLMKNRHLKAKAEALIQAASTLGSPLIRNRATIGGNLVTARPASDLAPPLMAMNAEVTLRASSRERDVCLDDYFLGPGQCVIEPDEILTEIRIPVQKPGSGGGYQKLGLRRALEIGIVNVAATLSLSDDGKEIKEARVVLGAVAPTPIRSGQAERVLIGGKAEAKTLIRAAQAAVGDSCAIDDFRGTVEYRCLMIEVLTRRALETALEAARRN